MKPIEIAFQIKHSKKTNLKKRNEVLCFMMFIDLKINFLHVSMNVSLQTIWLQI